MNWIAKTDLSLIGVAAAAQTAGSVLADAPWEFLLVNLGALVIVGFVVYRSYVVEMPANRGLVQEHHTTVLRLAAEHKADIIQIESEHRAEIHRLVDSFREESKLQRLQFLEELSRRRKDEEARRSRRAEARGES